tara:strand:- start:222 stop:455 length:234 start_codon:yes stop_codon:yes gene_type:complete
MLHKYINFKAFLISFAVGVFYIYLTDDYKKVIIVYPTPDNIDKNVFLDKSNNCFKYRLNQAKCPNDLSKIVDVGVEY